MVLGIGVDIIEIERVRNALERRPALEQRLFTPAEIKYCRQKANPYPSLAARFAAKEAVLKAMGVGLGSCTWHDIIIEVNSSGAPEVKLTGRAAALAASLGISEFMLSLSHAKLNAVAYVLAQ